LEFEDFYKLYPRKVGRAAARKAWEKLSDDDQTKAMSVLEHKYEWATTEMRYIPHPATWLNGRRWEDDILPELRGSNEVRSIPDVGMRTLPEGIRRRSVIAGTGRVDDDEPITEEQRLENIELVKKWLNQIEDERVRNRAKSLVRRKWK